MILVTALALTGACRTAPKQCKPSALPPKPPSAILTQAKEADYSAKYQLALDITSQMLKFPDDPEIAQVWAVRGSTYYLMGRKSKARSSWERAFEIDPCMKEIPELLKKLDSEPR